MKNKKQINKIIVYLRKLHKNILSDGQDYTSEELAELIDEMVNWIKNDKSL